MKRTLIRIALYLLLITAPLYWLDQWSKNWIVAEFADPEHWQETWFHLPGQEQGAQTSKVLFLAKDAPAEASPEEKIQNIRVIEGLFNLVRVHNRGVAFGMFSGWSGANWFFGILSTTVLSVVLFLWIRGKLGQSWLSALAISLLICGILGNQTDRLKHGYVVDFLDFYFGDYHWPSFNVADSCICVAAVLLFFSTLSEGKKQRRGGRSEVLTGA